MNDEYPSASRRAFLASTILLPFELQRAFGARETGEVTLEFFASGTGEPAPVYGGPSLAAELTNPLRVPHGAVWPLLYLNPAIRYRIMLRQNGTTQMVDPYQPGERAEMFRQISENAVIRSVSDKLQEILSVRDFGARGDGKTDDSRAIRAAVAAATAQRRELVFPAGIYLSSEAFDFSFTLLRVRGEGMVILRHTGRARACVIVDFGPEGYGHDNVLTNLIIEGSGTPGQDGLYSRHAHRSLRQNIWVRNVTGRAFHVVGEVVTIYTHCGCSNALMKFAHVPSHSLAVRGSKLIKRTTDVTFINFVADVGRIAGIDLDECDRCFFQMGTSEGIGRTPPRSPAAKGVLIGPNTAGLTFDGLHNELNTGGDFDISGKYHQVRGLAAESRADVAPYDSVKSIIVRKGAEGVQIENVTAYAIEVEAGAVNTSLRHIDCHRIDDAGTGTLLFDNRELYRSARRFPSRTAGNVENHDPLAWDWYQQGSGSCALLGSETKGRAKQQGTVHYTRNGNIVTFDLKLEVSAFQQKPSGELIIATKLPWPAADDTALAIAHLKGLALPAGCTQFVAYLCRDTVDVRITGLAQQGSITVRDLAKLDETVLICLAGAYRVSAT